MVDYCDEKLEKIENWFKHRRQNDVKNGIMKFEVNLKFLSFKFNEIIFNN